MNSITNNKQSLLPLVEAFKRSLINDAFDDFVVAHQQQLEAPGFGGEWIDRIRKENLDLLFYKLALSAGFQFPSNESTALLEKDYRLERGLYALKLHEIRKINTALAEQGIPFIFLKGMVLGALIDLKIYKRSVDIDLLFQEKDLTATLACLQALGYKRLPSEANGEFPMIHPTGTQLDVHYELTASSPFIYMAKINVKRLFKNIFYLPNSELSLPGMSLEWTLVYLCLHFGVNHQYNDFVLIYEIQRFVNRHRDKMDWAGVDKIIAKYDLEIVVAIVFILLADYSNETQWYEAKAKKILRKESAFERVVTFMQKHGLSTKLLQGIHNGLLTNDLPEFCANTYFKRRRFKKGNMAWSNGKYF